MRALPSAKNASLQQGHRVRLAALIVFITLLIVLWFFTDWLKPDALLVRLENFEPTWQSFALFLGLFALAGLLFFPLLFIGVAVSLVFPIHYALLCVALGSVTASMPGYLLGRYFGLSLLPVGWQKKAGPLRNFLDRKEGVAVFALRIAPTPPFTFTSLVSGIAAVAPLSYLLGTVFGIFPLLSLSVLLGRNALLIVQNPSVLSVLFLVAVALLGAVYFYARKNYLKKNMS